MSTDLRDELAARVREILDPLLAAAGTELPVREVSMFGGRAIMVDGKILVGAGKDGALLVRADDARHDELTARTGASQAYMAPGRDMGAGWLRVTAEAIEDDGELAFWVGVALEHNRAAAA